MAPLPPPTLPPPSKLGVWFCCMDIVIEGLPYANMMKRSPDEQRRSLGGVFSVFLLPS